MPLLHPLARVDRRADGCPTGRARARTSAAAIASSSLAGTTQPVSSSTISGSPPRSVPSTGTPRANDSRTASGWFSCQRDGTTLSAGRPDQVLQRRRGSGGRGSGPARAPPPRPATPARRAPGRRRRCRAARPSAGRWSRSGRPSPTARIRVSTPFSCGQPAGEDGAPGWRSPVRGATVEVGEVRLHPDPVRVDAGRRHLLGQEPARRDEPADTVVGAEPPVQRRPRSRRRCSPAREPLHAAAGGLPRAPW